MRDYYTEDIELIQTFVEVLGGNETLTLPDTYGKFKAVARSIRPLLKLYDIIYKTKENIIVINNIELAVGSIYLARLITIIKKCVNKQFILLSCDNNFSSKTAMTHEDFIWRINKGIVVH